MYAEWLKLNSLYEPYNCARVLNDRWALERAKSNVERYFPVVGILEELNSTLVVLEKKLPYFFAGVQEIYFKQLLGRLCLFDLDIEYNK